MRGYRGSLLRSGRRAGRAGADAERGPSPRLGTRPGPLSRGARVARERKRRGGRPAPRGRGRVRPRISRPSLHPRAGVCVQEPRARGRRARRSAPNRGPELLLAATPPRERADRLPRRLDVEPPGRGRGDHPSAPSSSEPRDSGAGRTLQGFRRARGRHDHRAVAAPLGAGRDPHRDGIRWAPFVPGGTARSVPRRALHCFGDRAFELHEVDRALGGTAKPGRAEPARRSRAPFGLRSRDSGGAQGARVPRPYGAPLPLRRGDDRPPRRGFRDRGAPARPSGRSSPQPRLDPDQPRQRPLRARGLRAGPRGL